ncbi:hypothetical protein EZY14_009240 [Kordia sp. TARA_039_SRF]|nr:hypothetical protein EZY14_009240 [Kordia sp. TARA_039_SRF]
MNTKSLNDQADLLECFKVNQVHHFIWKDAIDNHNSVELYRIMHGGNLPNSNDKSVDWIIELMNKQEDDFQWWADRMMSRSDFEGLFMTLKRMIYCHAEDLIKCKAWKSKKEKIKIK